MPNIVTYRSLKHRTESLARIITELVCDELSNPGALRRNINTAVMRFWKKIMADKVETASVTKKESVRIIRSVLQLALDEIDKAFEKEFRR